MVWLTFKFLEYTRVRRNTVRNFYVIVLLLMLNFYYYHWSLNRFNVFIVNNFVLEGLKWKNEYYENFKATYVTKVALLSYLQR